MFEYIWKPAHSVTKPEHIKVRDYVLYKGERAKVIRVDHHVHPICLEGWGRVALKDCKVLEESI